MFLLAAGDDSFLSSNNYDLLVRIKYALSNYCFPHNIDPKPESYGLGLQFKNDENYWKIFE